jgi:hypothetical protein
MNRQDICAGHYSEPARAHTSQRPFVIILRHLLARLVLGDLRGGTT